MEIADFKTKTHHLLSMARRKGQDKTEGKKYLFFLAYSALGVVYGDIGTSPLYALRACFHGPHSVDQTPANVLGVLSLIFWALILVVSVKYLLLILRADNQGEGGILALMELVLPEKGRQKAGVLILGLFGAALLYGDGTITPAISVLSAIEGLEITTPVFKPFILPITIAILFFLFLVQRRGTGKVGLIFGPVMLVWFAVIAITGTSAIMQNSAVLASLNPYHAFRFFRAQGFESLYILGAVFLVVTGGEALYADIGHFGRAPIRLAWFTVALPCLLLNYFGQGALILDHRAYASNPFYHLAPDWALYPMVVLAAAATIIASQAIISGVFSLTFQAVQLGYLPRLRIRHTSEDEKGQIYLPQINWAMFIATTAVVLGFRSSNNLAGAYGVAVSTTMVITSILGYLAMRDLWGWPRPAAACIAVLLLSIDFSFFSANMLKILHGGWYPLLAGATVYLLMSTWVRGQEIIGKQLKEYVQPLKSFINSIDFRTVTKVSGTAIYLTQNPLSTPAAFVQNIKHNKVVHRRVIFLSIGFKNVPYVRAEDRVYFKRLSKGFYRVLVRYGFMNRVDLQAAIRIIHNKHIKIDREDSTFFVGRGSMIPTRSGGVSKWRGKLYIIMNRNAERATKYFNLPPDQVLEIGVQIKF
jgi:KUP system potassium uptake protein